MRRKTEKAKELNRRWIALIACGACLAAFLGVYAIGASLESPAQPENATATAIEADEDSGSNQSHEISQEIGSGAAEQSDTTTSDNASSEENATAAAGSFELADVPAYSGNPTVEINGDEPFFQDSDLTVDSYESYSALDSLGRCGVAVACVGPDLVPTEEREPIGMIRPSGWHTVRYDGLVDGNYLYNRCHLIGYQLTGENANERNLITGTRCMNTEGMEPYESLVADYVESSGNHVLFRSTPVFEGEDLLASGVLLEAESVEDDGAGVKFCVWCYNVQPGVCIDYATGDSWLDEGDEAQADAETQADAENASAGNDAGVAGSAQTANEKTYILNTNTGKFHDPSCSSVDDMEDNNKKEYTGTREDVITQGFKPCGRCNP